MYFKVFLLLAAFLFICVGCMFFIQELCTHVADFFKYKNYKGKTEGTVLSVKKAELTSSRRLVEARTGKDDFKPVEHTLDRNFAYPPFKPGIGKNRYYPVFQWSIGEKEFRGHYPYLAPENRWKTGNPVEIHYSVEKPWNYAVKDSLLQRSACIYCLVDMAVIAAGIIIILNLISL